MTRFLVDRIGDNLMPLTMALHLSPDLSMRLELEHEVSNPQGLLERHDALLSELVGHLSDMQARLSVVQDEPASAHRTTRQQPSQANHQNRGCTP